MAMYLKYTVIYSSSDRLHFKKENYIYTKYVDSHNFHWLLSENLSSDSTLSSPSALNSPGLGIEGLNRRRKKRTSIETNIRVALEKSFLEVSKFVALQYFRVHCSSKWYSVTELYTQEKQNCAVETCNMSYIPWMIREIKWWLRNWKINYSQYTFQM